MIQAGIADAAIWSVEDLQMMIRLAECAIGVDVAALSDVDVHWSASAHIALEALNFVSSRLKVVFMLVQSCCAGIFSPRKV